MIKKIIFYVLIMMLLVVSCTRNTSQHYRAFTSPVKLSFNLLDNPSFEGDYVEIETGINVAPGWIPFYQLSSDKPEFGESNVNPHYHRIHSGQKAQKSFLMWRVSDYVGVYQVVSNIVIGSILEASTWVHAWSGYWCPDTPGYFDGDKPTSLWSDSKSDPPCEQVLDSTNITFYIGIDITGGNNPESPDIVWSDGHNIYDDYEQISVSAIAQNTSATVFIKWSAKYGFRINDAYIDDAKLTMTIPVTKTPTATATNTATSTPTATNTKTPRPTITLAPITPIGKDYIPIVKKGWNEPTSTPMPTPVISITKPGVALIGPDSVVVGDVFTTRIEINPLDKSQVFDSVIFLHPYLSFVSCNIFLPCSVDKHIKYYPGVISIGCQVTDTDVISDSFVFGEFSVMALSSGTYKIEDNTFIGKINGGGKTVEYDKDIMVGEK